MKNREIRASVRYSEGVRAVKQITLEQAHKTVALDDAGSTERHVNRRRPSPCGPGIEQPTRVAARGPGDDRIRRTFHRPGGRPCNRSAAAPASAQCRPAGPYP